MMEKYSAKRDGKNGWVIEAPIEPILGAKGSLEDKEFAARMVKEGLLSTLYQYSFYVEEEGRVFVFFKIETPDYVRVLEMYAEAQNMFSDELAALDRIRRVCRSEVKEMKKGE